MENMGQTDRQTTWRTV